MPISAWICGVVVAIVLIAWARLQGRIDEFNKAEFAKASPNGQKPKFKKERFNSSGPASERPLPPEERPDDILPEDLSYLQEFESMVPEPPAEYS